MDKDPYLREGIAEYTDLLVTEGDGTFFLKGSSVRGPCPKKGSGHVVTFQTSHYLEMA